MTQYYQISETGYPVISSIQLEGFTAYEIGKEPKELLEAIKTQEVKDKETEFRNERNRILSALDKPLWISSLTDVQKEELDVFYKALLDCTSSGVLPIIPQFCEKIVR